MELGLGLDLGFCLAGTEAGEVVAFVKKEVIWRCGLINGDAPLLRRRDDDIALCIRQTERERERTIHYLSIKRKRNEGRRGSGVGIKRNVSYGGKLSPGSLTAGVVWRESLTLSTL